MDSFPVFLRLSGRPVILAGTGAAAAAKRRLLERAGALVVDEDETTVTPPKLAIVAIEDAAEAESAVARLRARGILVNATDRPELCDFTLPAIVDRAPVLIAIGTGGSSAGLAAALRQRLEALLPASVGQLAEQLHAARRRIATRYPDTTARRHAISAALSDGGALDPLVTQSPKAVNHWLTAGAATVSKPMAHIPLNSKDPDELTLRVARLLAQADHVWHTNDVPRAILDRARADAPRTVCTRPPGEGEETAGGVFLFNMIRPEADTDRS